MTTPTPEEDLQKRWLPTDASVEHAKALLAAEPRADLAAIPMIQPGKQFGIWTTGQEVQTVPGVVFLGVNSFDHVDDITKTVVPSYAWARNAACEIARYVLGDQPGTVAFATVRPNGHVAVFEDFGRNQS